MAAGLAIAGEGGQYNGKMTWFVALSCMMASMGGVIFGYDIGISGLSRSPIKSFEMISSLPIACIFSSSVCCSKL
jgi:hypothetical protein